MTAVFVFSPIIVRLNNLNQILLWISICVVLHGTMNSAQITQIYDEQGHARFHYLSANELLHGLAIVSRSPSLLQYPCYQCERSMIARSQVSLESYQRLR